MGSWQSMTLGDVTKALARYRPFLAVVAAIVLVATILPGRGRDGDTELTAGATGTEEVRAGEVDAGGDPGGGGGTSTDGGTAGPTSGGTGGPTGGGTGTGVRSGTGTGGTTRSGTGTGTGTPTGPTTPSLPPGAVSANCDKGRGRIALPSHYAPPCRPAFAGPNKPEGPGVTADTVKVVWYNVKADAAANAALTAAGASDPRADQNAQVQQYFDFFNAHYERYGRKVVVETVEGKADASDDAAGRADAITVRDKKPFAVLNSPNNAFVDVLAKAKILCICTVSQPQELYEKYSPYVGYTTLMASTQGYIHRAEYIGKRLHGRAAKYAGTRDGLPMSGEQRKFGLLWYETKDNAYKSGIDFFKGELKNKYGVPLATDVAYNGFPEVAQTQEQARGAIQRLKGAGTNSVILVADPIAPAIFTAEATRQTWFPEWIITGSALVDTTLFARTYAKEQWSRAFGISYLVARSDRQLGDAYRLLQWHNDQEPRAANTHGTIYAPIFALFTGIHMAGPSLTPETFQKGIFSYPVSGKGLKTIPTSSWGNHGLWPRPDFTQFDDVTEIWWDNTSSGEDEVGNAGPGMYAYVDGGKRYLPGEHPRSEPKAFVRDGSEVTFYTTRPKGEEPPPYPPNKGKRPAQP